MSDLEILQDFQEQLRTLMILKGISEIAFRQTSSIKILEDGSLYMKDCVVKLKE